MSDHMIFLDFGLFSVYWYGFIMGVTVLLATGLFVLLRRMQGEEVQRSLTTALMAMPAALLGARVFYCWFAKALFSGGALEMMNLLTGGYALYGALLGILTVMAVQGLRHRTSVLTMLDAACPPVALAIAVERWTGLVNGSDIGFAVSSPWIQRFPFSLLSETDQVYHLWVGFFEGVTAMLLFLVLAAIYWMKYRAECKGMRCGDVALLFMMIYGFSQSFWESMRDDSLFMVTLGFVRINQIFSIVMALSAVIWLMVRKCQRRGVSAADAGMWTLCAAALGVAVYCEFTMNAVSMTRNYILLGVSLSVMLMLGICLINGSRKDEAGCTHAAALDRELPRSDAERGDGSDKAAPDGFASIDVDALDLDELKSLR